MFDIFQGRCDVATSPVKYCESDDGVCGTCTVTASRPVCYGSDGRCICPSLCTVVKSPRAACNGEVINVRLWLTFGAFALVLPLLLYLQRRWNEPGGVQHMLHNRRVRRQRQLREQQRDTTRDLELSTWRDHRELHKLEMCDIELKTCYFKLDDTAIPAVARAAAPPEDPVLSLAPSAANSTAPTSAAEVRDSMTSLNGIGADDDDESKSDDGDAEQQQIAVVVEKQ